MTTARDKYFYTRTLCCLLKSLEGVKTEIELRNESHVKGTVESVSAAMNVTMCNCELIREGRSKQLQRLLVQGRKIRMVAIPDHIDMVDAMQCVINMFNVKALGRNEFRKTPKQKGRGKFLGNGRGRGRGMNVRGRGRGDIGAHRGGRGRGAPQGIRDRNLVQRSQCFTDAVPADSRKRSESAKLASGSHSVDSSDGEVSMLRPDYMKQTFRDPMATSVTKDGNSRLHTQTVHALVHSQRERETSQNIDTTEQQDPGTRQTKSQVHDPRLRVSEVPCSAISSKARSAVASGDLRHKLLKHRSHQDHHDKPDVRHRDKSSRSIEDSRPSHQSSSREDEHYVERSSTYTGRLPEKQYHQTEKRREKLSHHSKYYDDGNQSRSHHSEYSYEGQPTSRESSYRRHQPVRDSRSTQGKERETVCLGDTRKSYAGGTELSSSAAKSTRDRHDVRDYSLSEVPSGESPLSRDRQSFRDRAHFREEDRSSADRAGNAFDSEDSPHRRDRPHSKGNRPHTGEKGRSVTDRNRSFNEGMTSKRDLNSKERSYSREEDRSRDGRESRPSSRH